MRFTACLCLALLIAGCVVAQELTARPGDGLAVMVLGEKDLSGKVMVRPDGTIALPLAGEVKVEGRTPAAIARLLSERLAEYVRNPQVIVEIVERAPIRIIISGAVKTPGVYFIPADSRLAEALAAAGGPTPAADLTRVSLVRAGSAAVLSYQRFLEAGDETHNPPLKWGDNLRVPERAPELTGARIQGKVVKPGPYQVGEGTTPWDLVAQAGGLAPGADPRRAVLKPREGEPQVIDLTALLEPQAMQNAPLVRAGDVLLIPALATQVYLLGGVVKPGSYYLPEGTRLLEAIAQASGTTEFAILDQAYLIRAAAEGARQAVREPVNLRRLLVEGDMTLNLELRSGDALFIPVRSPGTEKRPFLERAASLIAPFLFLFW